MTQTPWDDAAKPLLESEPGLTQDERAAAWDAFHSSATVSILARKLADIGAEPELAQKLCVAKHESLKPTDTEKTIAVMHHMSTIDRKILDAAESHPNVLKVLTAAKG